MPRTPKSHNSQDIPMSPLRMYTKIMKCIRNQYEDPMALAWESFEIPEKTRCRPYVFVGEESQDV